MLCPISAWEIGMLVQKGRLNLSIDVEDFVRGVFSAHGVVSAVLTAAIALKAATLAVQNDPADRLIIASAIAYGADLLTRDGAILRLAGKVPGLNVVRV
jgi:PIN domain nuclease of toxin-antitoxin system